MFKRCYISAILLLVVTFSCKEEKKSEQVKEDDLSLILEQKMDSIVVEYVNDDEPGLALLVSFDGEKLISKGYGLRDLNAKLPITSTTNMRLASVSKQFTALCVLTMVDKGLLSLDKSVFDIFPYRIFKNVTVEDLLNHTSGLPDYYDYFEKEWDKNKVVENSSVLEWLETNPEILFESGSDYRYSNTGYIVLAAIVEKISEMEFSAYAKKFLFNTASMNETNYFNLAKPVEIKERAFCYVLDSVKGFEKVDGYFMNGLMGDGAVYSSVDDYFNYDQALRKKTKKLLKNLDYDLIFKPSSTYVYDGVEKYYAMGWSVTDSTAAHTGGWLGTDTYTKRYLDFPLTIGIFSNRTDVLFDTGLWKKIDSVAYKMVQSKFE